MLGGLTIYPRIANFLQCMHAKNYENWLAVDKVITKIIRLTFFWPTLYIPCFTVKYALSSLHQNLSKWFRQPGPDEELIQRF